MRTAVDFDGDKANSDLASIRERGRVPYKVSLTLDVYTAEKSDEEISQLLDVCNHLFTILENDETFPHGDNTKMELKIISMDPLQALLSALTAMKGSGMGSGLGI